MMPTAWTVSSSLKIEQRIGRWNFLLFSIYRAEQIDNLDQTLLWTECDTRGVVQLKISAQAIAKIFRAKLRIEHVQSHLHRIALNETSSSNKRSPAFSMYTSTEPAASSTTSKLKEALGPEGVNGPPHARSGQFWRFWTWTYHCYQRDKKSRLLHSKNFKSERKIGKMIRLASYKRKMVSLPTSLSSTNQKQKS